jgi:hypothetical protein
VGPTNSPTVREQFTETEDVFMDCGDIPLPQAAIATSPIHMRPRIVCTSRCRAVQGAAPVRKVYAAALSFFARRASRYFLMRLFFTSLCFAQTMPKTGAAGFLQPGMGQS